MKHYFIYFLFSAGIFLLDVITPVRYHIWLLYLVPLLYTLRAFKNRDIFFLLISTVLVFLGYLLAPDEGFSFLSFSERFFDVAAFWVIWFFLIREKISSEKIKGQSTLIEELHAGKRRIEAVLANMPAGVIIAEAPSGKLVMGNEQVERIFRHPFLKSGEIGDYKEYRGFHLDGRPYEPEDWPLARSIMLGERVKNEEVRILRGDGTYGSINVSSAPIFDGKGKIAAGVVVLDDITERKRAEEALKKSEEMLYAALDNIPDLFVIYDPDRRIKFINKAATELTGRPLSDFIGKRDEELWRPAITSRYLPKLKRAVQTKRVQHFEMTQNLGNGRVYTLMVSYVPLLDESGGIYQVLGITHDITARKCAEEALRESEEKYRQVVELSPDAIAIHSDWKFVYVNPAGVRLFGAEDAGELIGKDVLDFVHPDYREFVGKRIRQSYEERLRAPLRESGIMRPDGQGVDVEAASTPIEYKGRPATQFVLRDITERKRAEEQIRASLKEKEILLREVYHRTKNNMQVISSLINLQAASIKDERVLQIFRDTQNRIQGMSLVHEKLYKSKDLYKVDLGEYIGDLVNGIFATYRAEEPKITLKTDLETVQASIDTAIPCGLILNELISNSFKYGFPDGRGGEITVSLKKRGEDGIELLFADDGVGLPADLDIKKTGSLGLKLIYNLAAKQLGGTVDLSSERGTEFRIRFSGRE